MSFEFERKGMPKLSDAQFLAMQKMAQRPKRSIKPKTSPEESFGWVKANLILHGVLNADGSWKF